MNARNVETLVIARAFTVSKRATAGEMVAATRRFAPTTRTEASWRDLIESTITALRERDVVDDKLRLRDREELARRIGNHTAKRWAQLTDLLLPAHALGVVAADTKSHARLREPDGWAAAIAARALGLWTDGAPPKLATVCDALAWRELGLPGKPKRCPAEIRALFVQRKLGSEPGTPAQQVRLLAAREARAPRPDPRALRDALIRNWLEAGTYSFADEVAAAARRVRAGVFGDRKVYISAAWDELRNQPAWSALSLQDFKTQLVSAHRAGDLVLARADLVAAMDQALVASSETVADGAEFHFIVRGQAS